LADTLTWSTPQVKGTPPGERDYHVSLALDPTTVLVFGGGNESDNWRHYNDVFLFDTSTLLFFAAVVGKQLCG